MDSHYLQKQRFQLQKRFRRLNSCDFPFFHSAFVQYWNYLQSHLFFKPILEKLDAEAPKHVEDIQNLAKGTFDLYETEAKALHFSYRLLEHCASLPMEINGRFSMPEVNLGHSITQTAKHAEALESFRDSFLEPFYEYLDESLDQTGAILSLLVKYRQRVEWFFDPVAAHAINGERKLAPHLYAYLHDQGLDFSIEPQGPSGIPDLVSRDLVMDVKLFDGDKRSVSYIASGVHQVHTYLREFEQISGYLVIYKTCAEALHFTFAAPDRQFPMLHIGGKIVFLVVIDICEHEASASKRGTLREFNVDEAMLVRQLTIDGSAPEPAV